MLNIVLYEPEIPQNTGNIMRTCVALGATLHLIEPFGFELSDRTLKRSGLDYVKDLTFYTYKNYDDFVKKNPGTYYFLSRYGKQSYEGMSYDCKIEDLYLLFGKESTGFDKSVLANNLSNAVAIVAFDAMRQYGFPGCIDHEPESMKGKDFLDQFKET